MKNIFIFIINILFFYQLAYSQVDNTKPMYGEAEKNDEYKKLDEKFIKNCLSQFKTIDSSYSVYLDFGWRYFYHNDLESSMKRFNQAWLLNPELPDAYFGFGALLEMTKDTIGAQRFYNIAFEKDLKKNRSINCLQRIADCKEKLHDFTGTVKSYYRILEIDPNNKFSYKKIGFFQMNLGKSNQALYALNKAIELDSSDAMTFNNRGYLYQLLSDNDKAILDYSQAIKLDSKYIGAYVNRGLLETEINNLTNAISDFEKCISIDSTSGELYRYLALAFLAQKDYKQACVNFNLAYKFGDLESKKLMNANCNK